MKHIEQITLSAACDVFKSVNLFMSRKHLTIVYYDRFRSVTICVTHHILQKFLKRKIMLESLPDAYVGTLAEIYLRI